MQKSDSSQEIDSRNRTFWDEPCGSTAYRDLGFRSPIEFDDRFFKYYPYLQKSIPFENMHGKRDLKAILGNLFSDYRIRLKNIGKEAFLRYFPRNWKLRLLGPILGLDLYAKLKK